MYTAVLILKGCFGCVCGKSAASLANCLISLMSYGQEVMGTDYWVSELSVCSRTFCDDARVLLCISAPTCHDVGVSRTIGSD